MKKYAIRSLASGEYWSTDSRFMPWVPGDYIVTFSSESEALSHGMSKIAGSFEIVTIYGG